MLTIQIFDQNRRKSALLELKASATPQASVVNLREDDLVGFSIVLDREYHNLRLILHENEINLSIVSCEKDRVTYAVHPAAFFRNYFGYAELCLVGKCPRTSEELLVKKFDWINVQATKINADKCRAMLDFLSAQDEDLQSAVRVTRINAGEQEGGRSPAFLLDKIEKDVQFLEKILPSIFLKPIVKFKATTRIVSPNQETNVDENALIWLLENPDFLYTVDSIEDAILSLDGEYFASNKIVEDKMISSVNVYENQVIHGFVEALIQITESIYTKLSDFTVDSGKSKITIFEGYSSLFDQLSKFKTLIFKKQIEKGQVLKRRLEKHLFQLQLKLPVSKPFRGAPIFTHKAKHHFLYQQIFNQSIALHRYGAPDWSFQDGLNSILNIPKLFEYYVFCVIKKHLDSLSANTMSLLKHNIFEYQLYDMQIRLKYEPDIWMVGHQNSFGYDLVNTEGYTHWNGEHKKRGRNSSKSRRTPDFMIEFINKNQSGKEIIYFIIDAKYTVTYTAFQKYLPELTMKYLHGIHQQSTGKSRSIGLMIVNPSGANEKAETMHFHDDDYSIYGLYPVTPALMVTSIDVSQAAEETSNLRRDISKVIDLVVNLKKENHVNNEFLF